MLSPTEVIKALIGVGVFANINQQVDFATAEKAAAALEIEVVPAEQATDAENITTRCGHARHGGHGDAPADRHDHGSC